MEERNKRGSGTEGGGEKGKERGDSSLFLAASPVHPITS